MSAGRRHVVLGLAGPRVGWFREVGRWATSAAIPVDFVRCVSVDEVLAHLGGGRPFSAVLVGGATPGVDRDLLDRIREAGAAALVVDDGRRGIDWTGLGATAVLPTDLDRADLMEVLERHARTVDPGERHERPLAAGRSTWTARLVAVTGGSGAGSSTVAMAAAQALGADPRNGRSVLLADLARRSDLAMYHDAGDIVPGLQELVDAHRSASPGPAELRSMVFGADDRGYDLLLGLRRHRDWAALRPRALDHALTALRGAWRVVVADVDPDVEGEDEVGSADVEERNLASRLTLRRADVVLVVGTPTLKGFNDLVRVVADLVDLGVDTERLLPVLNRSARRARVRAEHTATLAELVSPVAPGLLPPLHLPERASLEQVHRDAEPLPRRLVDPVGAALQAMLGRLDPMPVDDSPEPVPVVPGSLGHFFDDDPDDGPAPAGSVR